MPSRPSVTTVTMSVDLIEDTIATIKKEDGQVIQGKTPIPSMGWFATCLDTKGRDRAVHDRPERWLKGADGPGS